MTAGPMARPIRGVVQTPMERARDFKGSVLRLVKRLTPQRGLTAMVILLVCRAEGLGCVLTTLLCKAEPEVRKLLAIPQPWGTAAAVPVGYPQLHGQGPISRRPVGEMAFVDSWERPFA